MVGAINSWTDKRLCFCGMTEAEQAITRKGKMGGKKCLSHFIQELVG